MSCWDCKYFNYDEIFDRCTGEEERIFECSKYHEIENLHDDCEDCEDFEQEES